MAVHPGPRRRPSEPVIPRPRCGTSRPQVPAQRVAIRLTVLAEAGCSPLWVERGRAVENTAPTELPIPPALAAELAHWGRTPVDGDEFYAHGMMLAMRLAESLGRSCSVRFFDGREGCLRDV